MAGNGVVVAVRKRLALGLAVGLLVGGCGSPRAPGDAARIDAELVAELAPGDARTVSAAVNAFGFDLLHQVGDGRENAITSPLSVTAMLAMVLAGAGGDTAGEIAAVLHLADRRDVRVGALLRELADTDEVTLSVADALWADPGSPLEKDYAEFVRQALGATAEEADLGDPATAAKIDEWAAKNTDGLIDRIAADLGLPDAAAAVVLLNAVYFRGEWSTPFDPAATRDEAFTLGGGGKADVPTMRISGGEFGHARRDGFRMLRLPYGEDGRYGMEIMLPDTSLDTMLASLDAQQWQAAVGSLSAERFAEVTLPRFELRWKGELTEPLRKLGMPAAFTPGQADFRPMSPSAPALATVVHKTYLKVDEKGTEAAAVTGGAMETSVQVNPNVFRVDRPFAFTISDRQTGAILFLGAVTDPRAGAE
jgi:serine protease inhibitor